MEEKKRQGCTVRFCAILSDSVRFCPICPIQGPLYPRCCIVVPLGKTESARIGQNRTKSDRIRQNRTESDTFDGRGRKGATSRQAHERTHGPVDVSLILWLRWCNHCSLRWKPCFFPPGSVSRSWWLRLNKEKSTPKHTNTSHTSMTSSQNTRSRLALQTDPHPLSRTFQYTCTFAFFMFIPYSNTHVALIPSNPKLTLNQFQTAANRFQPLSKGR